MLKSLHKKINDLYYFLMACWCHWHFLSVDGHSIYRLIFQISMSFQVAVIMSSYYLWNVSTGHEWLEVRKTVLVACWCESIASLGYSKYAQLFLGFKMSSQLAEIRSSYCSWHGYMVLDEWVLKGWPLMRYTFALLIFFYDFHYVLLEASCIL